MFRWLNARRAKRQYREGYEKTMRILSNKSHQYSPEMLASEMANVLAMTAPIRPKSWSEGASKALSVFREVNCKE